VIERFLTGVRREKRILNVVKELAESSWRHPASLSDFQGLQDKAFGAWTGQRSSRSAQVRRSSAPSGQSGSTSLVVSYTFGSSSR
jgi:hypothetical protein